MIARAALRQSVRATRAYATQAAKSTPPVKLFGIDGSYASALYTASAKSSSIEATEKSLASLKTVLEKDTKLKTILENPSLSAGDKKEVVDALVKASSVDETVANFLSVLADNNRLGLVSDVIRQFETLSNAYHGLVEATVTSAEALDKKTLNRLEAALQKSEFVGKGKQLKLTNKVNADILGGLVVEVGDRTVDLSVSAKIARLNKLLTDTV
uniref:ATP synthase subunit 5, mitochondrial n=1 Tax=Blastobotrys adeninivorans TaxID=409370 RepID=A0A060T3B9_BLAAD